MAKSPLSEPHLRQAILLSLEGVQAGLGGPFGALITRDGEPIARGQNQVTSSNDPTAHAEIVAIRAASKQLGSFDLSGCEIFSSCEPCPMCMAAILWAHLDGLTFAATRADAAAAGFDDEELYRQLALAPAERDLPTRSALRTEALTAFDAWRQKPDKTTY